MAVDLDVVWELFVYQSKSLQDKISLLVMTMVLHLN